ncbi:MAG: hypothetical protein A2W85_18510 [Bacteroidetes bacterium GWF2_41_31]|nr:MAG: hypothetical protein A2W85_18510 [Bacteroidetes bacterium GWF2_41_31]OFZ09146.1 MAG: hypothetical protein A2338_05920 [Bacteroidetes bacterium RIFOXYB12_FULL_41_6]
MSIDLIFSHFPSLTDTQRDQFMQLQELYAHWNAQINVISRKDMEQFYNGYPLRSVLPGVVVNSPLLQTHTLFCNN